MPAPTRPPVIPIWTVGNTGARTQPTNGEQFAGFVPNFRPPGSWHNWLFGEMSDWIAWLDYATQGNMPVSNSGHNILTGTTVQAQLDQTDQFLSGLGVNPVGITGGPTVFSLSILPVNGSNPIVVIDGVVQVPTTDFTYAVVSGIGQVTLLSALKTGQLISAYALTTTSSGASGVSNRAVFGSISLPVIIDPTIGIIPTASMDQTWFVSPSGGGIHLISAIPMVGPGTIVGQRLTLKGVSATNYLIVKDKTLVAGSGLNQNGECDLTDQQAIEYEWDGSNWNEDGRRT